MDFLTQANNLAKEILELTGGLKLTGQPDLAEREVDAYAGLMNKRAPMVDKLTSLLNQDTSGDKKRRRDVEKIIGGIIDLDKEHQRIMKHLRESVMASLKETRSGQLLNKAYLNPMDGLAASRFEARQ